MADIFSAAKLGAVTRGRPLKKAECEAAASSSLKHQLQISTKSRARFVRKFVREGEEMEIHAHLPINDAFALQEEEANGNFSRIESEMKDLTGRRR